MNLQRLGRREIRSNVELFKRAWNGFLLDNRRPSEIAGRRTPDLGLIR